MTNDLIAQLTRWHQQNKYQKIVDAIAGIALPDRDYEIASHLARALNNLEHYEQALEQLMQIAEAGESDPLWHFRVGYAYYYMDRYAEAIAAFEQADKLNPGDQSTLMLLSLSRQGAKQGEDAVPFEQLDFSSFWEDSDYARKEYVSAPPTDEMIASVEQELGYKLPADYIRLMKVQNGGIPRDTCFPTEEGTSWAEDHIAISSIMGIGRDKSYSLCGELGSRFMIEEWGYPDIGVVICDCPSAGHDVVMLDYRACGKDGEPAVIHVDQEGDYEITFLAPSFGAFIRGLVNEEEYDTSEEDMQIDLVTVSRGIFSPLLSELCGNVTEVDDLEGKIRAVCTRIVEQKGHFSFHADELSTLMYDVQFWLYTKSYPNTGRQAYLDSYSKIIAFGGGGFSQGGYAPGFIADWLDGRINQGMIVETDGALHFKVEAIPQLLARLQEAAADRTDAIEPFMLVEQAGGGMSVILNVGNYKQELFLEREDEGFEGNGYDWASLATVFLEERMPELADVIHFDPEADMFCAYSDNREALQSFARAFKATCEEDAFIRDLFSRAELD